MLEFHVLLFVMILYCSCTKLLFFFIIIFMKCFFKRIPMNTKTNMYRKIILQTVLILNHEHSCMKNTSKGNNIVFLLSKHLTVILKQKCFSYCSIVFPIMFHINLRNIGHIVPVLLSCYKLDLRIRHYNLWICSLMFLIRYIEPFSQVRLKGSRPVNMKEPLQQLFEASVCSLLQCKLY